MSGRVMVMEDGRARESEGGEHDMDELLVLLLSAVTFENKSLALSRKAFAPRRPRLFVS
jgi:hypothetical protein